MSKRGLGEELAAPEGATAFSILTNPHRNQGYGIIKLVVSLFLLAILLSSCSQQRQIREQIAEGLAAVRAQIPISVVPGTSMLWVDAYLDDDNDVVVFIFQANAEDAATYFLPQENLNDERNIARVVNGMNNNIMGEEFVDLLIKAEVGLQVLIFDSQSGEQLRTLSITPGQLRETRDKLASGELQPYDILDILRMEVAAMEFPQQLDEMTWLTNAYVDGSNVVYECMVDLQVDPGDLTEEDIREIREEIVEDLVQDPVFKFQCSRNKESILKEDIHFVYIFRDNRGEEFMRHDIAPRDIWPLLVVAEYTRQNSLTTQWANISLLPLWHPCGVYYSSTNKSAI